MFDLSRIRIGFVAGTLGQGGSERQLFYILKALKELGANVRVWCLQRGEFWETAIGRLGISVKWVGRRKARASRLASIVREIVRDPVDVIQSQHFYTNLYALAAGRLIGVPDVGAMRSTVSTAMEDTGRMAGALCLHGPRTIAVNSRATLHEALARGVPTDRLAFLPNVVDTRVFYPSDSAPGRPIVVLGAGRLVAEKRFDRFLELLGQLQRRAPGRVMGRILGSGSLATQLKRQAVEMGLGAEAFELCESVADVAAAYRRADLFVMTSDAEGSPNVVLEAMASGLPVVATRVGGIPDIVQDRETGFLTDPAQLERMTDRVLELVEDSKLRREFGRRARDYVVSEHSSIRLADSLRVLYQGALS